MATRLAITLSGAVSLGSYEAGVLYEVLYALKQHNEQPGISDDQKIYIDVVTGASAGALSAALAVQKILYEASSLDDPYNNPLYNAWVTEVDIEDLLNLAPDESPSCSLFSSDLIESLTQKYLLSRYSSGTALPRQAHPAVLPDQTVRLGFALSNLCGIDYIRPTLSSGTFTYTRFQDQFTMTLGPSQDSQAPWGSIAQAAVACSAFPFAFRVQDLVRTLDCYNSSPFFDPSCFGGATSRSFTYTDGGLFQNQPLGLAKKLVDSIDQQLNSDRRAYLFIAPDPKTSTADDSFSASVGFFNRVAARVLLSVFDQARFEDWIEAEKLNDRIARFNSHAMSFHQLLKDGALTAGAIKHVLAPLARQLSSPAAARTRLQGQFSTEYNQLVELCGVDAARGWIEVVLLLETAANLADKEEMYIYAITASQNELAGSPLMAFLGFFDREYRDHDYDVGRMKARTFLRNPASGQQGPLFPISYAPQPIRPLQCGLTGISIQQVSLEKRQHLCDRLRNRVGIMLKELGLSFLVRHAIQLVFLNGKINELLGL